MAETRRPMRVDRVVTRGASELLTTRKGNELEVYGSLSDALQAGVPREAAEHVFRFIAELKASPGSCVTSSDLEVVVTCDSLGCTGSCRLYSVPRNWKSGGKPPQEERQPAMRVACRIYFCLCTH